MPPSTPLRLELELLRELLRDQKELFKEQKEDIKALQKEVASLKENILEIRLGKKWLWALLSCAALLGGLIDTIMKLLKVY